MIFPWEPEARRLQRRTGQSEHICRLVARFHHVGTLSGFEAEGLKHHIAEDRGFPYTRSWDTHRMEWWTLTGPEGTTIVGSRF